MKPNMNGDWPQIGARIMRMPTVLLGLASLSATLFGGGAAITVGLTSLWGFSTTALGGLILGGAALLGSSLLRSRGGNSAAPQTNDVQTNIREPIGPRRRAYSRLLLGSKVVFGFRRGEKSYLLHYICEGPIEGFVSFRLDKKPVVVNESGYVTTAQYITGGRSRVQLLTTLGTMSDEPFDKLIEAFPELDHTDPGSDIYGMPFRHRGCAMVLQIVEQVPQEELGTVYPNNMPSLQVVIDAKADILDPRDDTTAFTGNAGLVLLHEIMDVYGITSNDTDKCDFDAFADFADHCDDDIALKAGGTEKRYSAAGVILANAENEQRIASVAGICNADVFIDRRGRISVRQKLTSTPGITLAAKNGDHLTVDLEGGRSDQKKFNTVKAVYVDPSLNYKENQVTWQHAGDLSDDGVELSQSLDLRLCPSPTQAQRLAKLFLHENNPEFAGQLTSGPQALDLLDDYCFTLDLSPEDDFTRVANAAGDIGYDPDKMTVSTPVLIFANDATAWDEDTDEQDQVIVPPVLLSNVDDVLLDVTVVADFGDNDAPVLAISWEPNTGTLPDSYAQQVQISVADAENWFDAAVNQEADTAQYGPVVDGGAYDGQIRSIAGSKKFEWQPFGPFTVATNLDTATMAYVAAMDVDPDYEHKVAIDALVRALKTAGVWTKLDFLYLLAAHDEQAGRLNLVNPGTWTLANSGATFTTDRGFAGNGSNAYMSAGVAWDALPLCLQNSQHMGVWVNGGTDAAATKYAMGQGGGTAVQSLRPRSSAGDVRALLASSGTSALGAVGTIIGHTVAVRTGASASEAYRNGASTGTSSAASTARSTGSVVLHRDGSVYADYRLSAAHAGTSLNGTEAAAIYNALDVYMTAIGA